MVQSVEDDADIHDDPLIELVKQFVEVEERCGRASPEFRDFVRTNQHKHEDLKTLAASFQYEQQEAASNR